MEALSVMRNLKIPKERVPLVDFEWTWALLLIMATATLVRTGALWIGRAALDTGVANSRAWPLARSICMHVMGCHISYQPESVNVLSL